MVVIFVFRITITTTTTNRIKTLNLSINTHREQDTSSSSCVKCVIEFHYYHHHQQQQQIPDHQKKKCCWLNHLIWCEIRTKLNEFSIILFRFFKSLLGFINTKQTNKQKKMGNINVLYWYNVLTKQTHTHFVFILHFLNLEGKNKEILCHWIKSIELLFHHTIHKTPLVS